MAVCVQFVVSDMEIVNIFIMTAALDAHSAALYVVCLRFSGCMHIRIIVLIDFMWPKDSRRLEELDRAGQNE